MICRKLMRNALVAAGLASLAACVVNLGFSIKKSVPVQAPSTAAVSQTIDVDLLQSKEVADHRDSIRSLDLDYADITVAAKGFGNYATVVNGTLKLRKSAAGTLNDVLVGSLTNFALNVGNTTRLQGSPQLDAFLLDALHGDGKFIVVIDGASFDQAADVTFDIDLHASLGYDAGPF